VIYLVFTDDWELWGDGSGHPEKVQFQPMRELVRIFNRHGVRASFYVEVMQQLSFRQFQDRYPELKELADRWDAAVAETFRQGHDIQMHLHPQWRNAVYEGGHWQLSTPWSLLDHDPTEVKHMLSEGKSYLEDLLRRVDQNYRCLAFRSGHWCIAPSPFALPTLAELGFTLDTSIVGGIRYRTKEVQLDYRNVEEGFWPYYPSMDDARKRSTHPEPIVCVPTHHLNGQRFRYLRRDMKLAWQCIVNDNRAAQPGNERAVKNIPSLLTTGKKILNRYLIGETHISDISHLDYSLLLQVMNDIRKRARKRGAQHAPVVLAGHSKDIRNFADIDCFLSDIKCADDFCCVTLTELAGKLADGTIPVGYAN
jgi:hypothetical protein